MSANEATTELEILRYRWRGDEVEMATVGILADQYMRVGRFRDALLLAQSTALRDASAPGARDLRIKLSDYFRRLFLAGEADRLDPIQAVALFYEFDDTLMPIGPDGDQMVRKLAQRLVAFDLLEPASVLLQYQVDNRIRGVGKAARRRRPRDDLSVGQAAGQGAGRDQHNTPAAASKGTRARTSPARGRRLSRSLAAMTTSSNSSSRSKASRRNPSSRTPTGATANGPRPRRR
jgi:hypothetical protein